MTYKGYFRINDKSRYFRIDDKRVRRGDDKRQFFASCVLTEFDSLQREPVG